MRKLCYLDLFPWSSFLDRADMADVYKSCFSSGDIAEKSKLGATEDRRLSGFHLASTPEINRFLFEEQTINFGDLVVAAPCFFFFLF
jgi:hypothetical protein